MGLIDAGIDLVNSWLGRKQSSKDAAINRQFEREMSDLKWSRDLEMWNMQNAYNSPTSQMERFREAGLNPNLMYGQGNSGNASSLPSYQAPKYAQKVDAMKLPMLIDQYQNMKIKQAQIDNLQKDVDIKEQDRINKQLQGGALQRRNKLFDDTFQYQLQGKELSVEKGRKDVEYKTKQIDKVIQDISNLKSKQRKTNVETEIKAIEKLVKHKQWELFRELNVDPQGSIWRTLMYMIQGSDSEIPYNPFKSSYEVPKYFDLPEKN